MLIKATIVYPKGSFGSEIEQRLKIELEVTPVMMHDPVRSGVLENIFRMMNRVDGSDIEHYLKKYECRSMSVGDRVEFEGGTIWYCSPAGWKEVFRCVSIDGNGISDGLCDQDSINRFLGDQ